MTGSRMLLVVLIAAAVFAMSAGVGAAATLTVDDDGGADYTKIGDAVWAANTGDTVFVHSGVYHEGINIYTGINLIGENMYSTIIDADNIYDPIYISGTNIQVSSFTLRNGGSDFAAAGIYLFESNNIILSELYVTNNSDGIFICGSNNVTVSDNIVVSNDADGMVILESSNCLIDSNNASLNGDDGIDVQINSYTNIVSNNVVSSNADNGIIIQLDSTGNTVHHNNISANIQEDARDTASSNSWDDGAEGNYYSDYTGIDSNGDGIGDAPYNIPGGSSVDHYPLVGWSGDGDTTPPTLTITSPANGTTVNTSTITIMGTASDESGIANVTVNGILATGTTDWSAEVTLTEGENMITVVATDTAGNSDTKTVTVTASLLSLFTVTLASGPAGTAISINGSGFVSGATVTIGGVTASSNVISSNLITATVPTLPVGVYDVKVTNLDGSYGILTDAFEVTETDTDLNFINTSVNSLYIGDADNDGENEITITTGSNITVWKHNPDGTYSLSWSEYIENVGWGTTAVVVGDVDNDGENEIAVAASSPHDISSGGTVRIYEYNSGTYGLAWSATIGEYIENHGLFIGDSDNDGNNELLVGVSWYGRKILLFKHDTGNIYNQVWNDNLGSDVASTCIGDVDNDGQNEIIAGTGSWGSYDVRIYEHSTGNSYSLAWNNQWSSHRHESVFVGDADNNGLNELLVIRNNPWSDDDDVAIFEHVSGNTYALNWSQTLVQQGGTSHTNAVIGDVDNDGNNEFVIATGDRVIRYDPSHGTYVNVWNDTVNVRTVRIGDVDNDGYNELIAGGDKIYIYDFGAAENQSSISSLIFEDTFDNGLINWSLFGQPRPVVRTDRGNPQPCFDNQGDANYDSGGISTTTFNYSSGLMIESDMYVNDARYSGCWVGATFGIASSTVLTDTGGIPPAIGITHEAIGPLCWMDPDKQGHGRIRYYIINESGMTESFDILDSQADSDLGSWHTYGIYIRPDRIVEFYKDGELVYTTKSMVSTAYNDMPIVLGARSHSSYGPALHDNVKVYTVGIDTTPPTLTITSPANGTTVNTSTITIMGTASDESGITNVTVDGILATGTTDWSAEVTLTEGENMITVVATDTAGNTATGTITVRYEMLRGDLSGDDILTPADAAIALEIAAGSRPCDPTTLAAADVSGDGQVTSLDALMILQAAAGKIEL